jgi:hypothetical protein
MLRLSPPGCGFGRRPTEMESQEAPGTPIVPSVHFPPRFLLAVAPSLLPRRRRPV